MLHGVFSFNNSHIRSTPAFTRSLHVFFDRRNDFKSFLLCRYSKSTKPESTLLNSENPCIALLFWIRVMRYSANEAWMNSLAEPILPSQWNISISKATANGEEDSAERLPNPMSAKRSTPARPAEAWNILDNSGLWKFRGRSRLGVTRSCPCILWCCEQINQCFNN